MISAQNFNAMCDHQYLEIDKIIQKHKIVRHDSDLYNYPSVDKYDIPVAAINQLKLNDGEFICWYVTCEPIGSNYQMSYGITNYSRNVAITKIISHGMFGFFGYGDSSSYHILITGDIFRLPCEIIKHIQTNIINVIGDILFYDMRDYYFSCIDKIIDHVKKNMYGGKYIKDMQYIKIEEMQSELTIVREELRVMQQKMLTVDAYMTTHISFPESTIPNAPPVTINDPPMYNSAPPVTINDPPMYSSAQSDK
jgi:hypothetical protein